MEFGVFRRLIFIRTVGRIHARPRSGPAKRLPASPSNAVQEPAEFGQVTFNSVLSVSPA